MPHFKARIRIIPIRKADFNTVKKTFCSFQFSFVITKVEEFDVTSGEWNSDGFAIGFVWYKKNYIWPDALQVFWVARGLFSFLNWQAGSVERTPERAAPTPERTAACDSLAKILKGTHFAVQLLNRAVKFDKFSFRGIEGQDYWSGCNMMLWKSQVQSQSFQPWHSKFLHFAVTSLHRSLIISWRSLLVAFCVFSITVSISRMLLVNYLVIKTAPLIEF